MFVISRERKIYIYTLPYEQNLKSIDLVEKDTKTIPYMRNIKILNQLNIQSEKFCE